MSCEHSELSWKYEEAYLHLVVAFPILLVLRIQGDWEVEDIFPAAAETVVAADDVVEGIHPFVEIFAQEVLSVENTVAVPCLNAQAVVVDTVMAKTAPPAVMVHRDPPPLVHRTDCSCSESLPKVAADEAVAGSYFDAMVIEIVDLACLLRKVVEDDLALATADQHDEDLAHPSVLAVAFCFVGYSTENHHRRRHLRYNQHTLLLG
mmetsp:Transcript_15388/g.33247  ORF Transcript_15388/g.33247 Transcript_15388/m.33247 type:complete len:206 (+) Transcript_15388:1332-1949(+)